MGTGRGEALALLNKAVRQIRPARRWQNLTLDLKIGGGGGVTERERKNYSFTLIPLEKQLLGLECYRCFGH